MSAKKPGKLRKRRKAVAAAEDNKPTFWGRPHPRLRFLLPAAVFFWPLLYLFRHVFPINGQYEAIGNDFILLYYKYKVYFLACLAEYRFPLWSPAEGAGYPFYTNPFTQAFYPLNLILVLWYKISGGYNPLDHQIFTILGISIFALGNFCWLRLINKNLRAVVFGVLIMSVSFKVTEIMRFPNAVHTAAWYPWVLYALTKIMLSKSLKEATVGGLLLAFFLICLCTGGYPYYVYYALFLFGPYMLIFPVKALRLRLIGSHPIHWKRGLITLAAAGTSALLVCAPYVLGIKRLMAETIDRAGKDFGYSTAHIFNFEDTLGSLVYPPAASTEGWYFFSIAGLLMILLYMVSKSPEGLHRRTVYHEGRGKDGGKSQRENLSADSLTHQSAGALQVKLFFVIWIVIITYISYGRDSYLFKLLWNYMPGFSSLRVWGRLNIILVPILAWLLSISYNRFESMLTSTTVSASLRDSPRHKKRSYLLTPIVVLTVAYTCILCVQIYFYHNNIYDRLWTIYFERLSPQRLKFIFYGAVAFAAFFSIILLSKRVGFKSNRRLSAVLAVLVLVATVEMRHVGVRVWTYQRQTEKKRIHPDVAKLNEASFRTRRSDNDNSRRLDTIPLGPYFSVGVLPNWYFGRYNEFLKETEDELEARRILLGVSSGRKIFFSESIEHPTVQAFLLDASRYKQSGQLVSYTGDELIWEINAPADGYLSFIDNWGRGWKVFVDDKEADIELLFGTFKSVLLTPGQHRVRFCYQPSLF